MTGAALSTQSLNESIYEWPSIDARTLPRLSYCPQTKTHEEKDSTDIYEFKMGRAIPVQASFDQYNTSKLDSFNKTRSRLLNSITSREIPDKEESTAAIYEFKKSLLPTFNKLIAEWQGRVVSIHEDYFVADVDGLIGEGVEGTSEEAIIPIMDVQESDKSQFRVGAFFRLCINYHTLPNKRRIRATTVSFRRLPAYSTSELNAADERARDITSRLRVE
jgi:hypothetical protein